jgi:hypothetical protein
MSVSNTLDFMKRNPEMLVYQAGKYSDVAYKVDLCMKLSSRRCAGGECDYGNPCKRHQNITRVVSRYLRVKG